MRIGEAIALDDDDFDTTPGCWSCAHAKFGKSRLIPLHPSTVTALQAIDRHRDSVPRPVSAGAAGLHHRHPAALLQRRRRRFAQLVRRRPG